MKAEETKAVKSKASEFILPQGYSNPLEEVADVPITSAKKMKKTVYFRVKDGEGFDPLTLMTLPDPRDMEEKAFIVHPEIVGNLAEIADQMSTSWCYLVITRGGEKKILYLPALTELNKGMAMLVHRARIVEEAKSRWLRMTWDSDVRMHRAIYPKFDIPEPDWGDLPPLDEIVFEAFEGRVIESVDHELVNYLLGAK